MATIFYAAFNASRPVGGVLVLHQHVEILREAGWDARLWLLDEPDGGEWLAGDLPLEVGGELELGADDLLVVPEVPNPPGADPGAGSRTVIFNQNHFLTFAARGWGDQPYPGWRTDPAAVWVVSGESRDVVGALMPDVEVRVIPVPIDTERFTPAPGRTAGIAWMARKRTLEATIISRLLHAEPRAASLRLRSISDLSHDEVATVLGEVTVFLSLGHREGFGLPVAEAMAAGCLIVGYDGGGGRDLFAAPGAFSIPDPRPLALVDRALELAGAARSAALGESNRRWILDRHTRAHTAVALEAAVVAALRRPGRSATAIHPQRWIGALGPEFFAAVG